MPTDRLPPPGTALAALAVFIALAGSAWAATKVDTSGIANKAITTKKLAKKAVGSKQLASKAVTTGKIASDAVTGAKVDEASLGQVPSAADADTIGGLAVSKFSDRKAPNNPDTTVATLGTIDLRFGCSAQGRPSVSVVPADGAPDQTTRASVTIGDGTDVDSFGEGTLPSGGITILNGANTSPSFNGTIESLTEAGAVTTVQWAARSTSGVPSANPDGNVCLFWGTGTAG